MLGLGTLIVLARGVGDAQALPTAVAAAGGVAFVALLAITVDESERRSPTSTPRAVSIQNLAAAMSQRLLITLVSAAATGLALVLNLGNYQNFLYLLGSFFVPLFGVLLADWLAAGRALRRGEHLRARRPSGSSSSAPGSSASASTSGSRRSARRWWTQLVAHTHPGNVSFTASLPSFAVSFALAFAFSLAARGSAAAVPAEVGVRRTRLARVRPLAVIGNLSRDVVAGGAPRIGGGPWHAARALRTLRPGATLFAQVRRAGAARLPAAARGDRARRRRSSPGGETTGVLHVVRRARHPDDDGRRDRRAVARARGAAGAPRDASSGCTSRRCSAATSTPQRSQRLARGRRHPARRAGPRARAAVGPLVLDADFDPRPAPPRLRC